MESVKTRNIGGRKRCQRGFVVGFDKSTQWDVCGSISP